VFRAVWYALLAVVYVVLSVTTLRGIIAMPKPEFLPYLGLAVAVLLGLMILYLFYQLFTYPDRIIVDGSSQNVIARRGDRERWRLENVAVESVYISQVVNRKGKKPVVHHGELNIRLQDGSFFPILSQSQPFDDLLTPADADDTDGVVSLTARSAYTDLQMAALWVAQTLRVPCWYDRRVK
jgi:hypothetical protein